MACDLLLCYVYTGLVGLHSFTLDKKYVYQGSKLLHILIMKTILIIVTSYS